LSSTIATRLTVLLDSVISVAAATAPNALVACGDRTAESVERRLDMLIVIRHA
jgi:hypothetical protein